MADGLLPSSKPKIYLVRLRCVTVDTLEVEGSCETEAVEIAIQSFEERAAGYDNVESLSLETRLLADDHASREYLPSKHGLWQL
jgi:hypothetical protein